MTNNDIRTKAYMVRCGVGFVLEDTFNNINKQLEIIRLFNDLPDKKGFEISIATNCVYSYKPGRTKIFIYHVGSSLWFEKCFIPSVKQHMLDQRVVRDDLEIPDFEPIKGLILKYYVMRQTGLDIAIPRYIDNNDELENIQSYRDKAAKEFEEEFGKDADPLAKYINGTTIKIEDVSVDDLLKAFEMHGHRVEGEYIYGVKFVSKDHKHMFANEETESYVVGCTYEYNDSDEEHSKFEEYIGGSSGVHTAGLWSYGCIKNSIATHENVICIVPILVRYPIRTTMPIGTLLKGKVMEVVSIDFDDVSIYLK